MPITFKILRAGAPRIVGSLVLALWLSMPGAQAAEPAPTLYVLFDGSGSMWGKLASTSAVKLQAGRDAIRQGLAKIPSTSKVGLASFGHRRQGDCSDVEVMLPAEDASTDRIMTPLDKLNPKGKGPLVAALREVAKVAELGSVARPGGTQSAIVLVHDDLDNCQQDVCAAARDIAAAQPGLAVHVVSLGMRKEDFARMSCLPKATGGQHFDIQEPAQIATAIEEAFRFASATTTAPRPQPVIRPRPTPLATAPAAALSGLPAGPPDDAPVGLYPTALLAAGQPALSIATRWALYPVPRGSGPSLAETTGAAPHLAVAPGRYTLVARSGLVEREITVDIKSAGPTRLTLPLDAALLRLTGGTSSETARATARRLVAITEAAGSGRTLWLGDADQLVVPPGAFRVSTTRGTARLFKEVATTAGATVDVPLGPQLGRITLSASDRDGGTPLAPILFVLTEDAPDAPTGRREVARSAAPRLDMELAPGTYYVTARHGAVEARDTVAVGPAESVTRTLVMPIARLTVTARLKGTSAPPGDDITHRILQSTGDQIREIARGIGPTHEFVLPAGRYTIESRIGNQNSVGGTEIDLAAGQQYRVAIDHSAGEVRLKLVDPTGKLNLADIHWDIRDASDRSIWRTVQREPFAILAAGRYKVRIEARDRRIESAFEVRVGEARKIEITVE